MRTFETGATRDTDQGKPDYEGFLSPRVIQRFGEYMHRHRQQADGKLRDSDNWQKGIPLSAYVKSMWRHFFDLWKLHRGLTVPGVNIEEACCAILFNAQGYLHETLKNKPVLTQPETGCPAPWPPQDTSSAFKNLIDDIQAASDKQLYSLNRRLWKDWLTKNQTPAPYCGGGTYYGYDGKVGGADVANAKAQS